ncbi:acyl-CoA carboxylase subunit beta [Lutimaribacter sp. EGI FJ00015]|uniref:Acyl-CoA carboxylase subunit beta n=1 Tax=Lutimaribacter degradans TaxID=2945989 RepID=A0ACC6A057_9RHOB|nr:carboxyl transferase domain-containing protein [Lutimaribacter sp. EGI FJ00013]MCM2563553.1 acyl-CoA carboxylase subunit beta [Lutimaribacter sp. EGI FJ00013]MCO0614784.1 acyl-CoA carboxylase subunit beta [Lutimaribacter sp. EGI FJ00015]MCO0637453.1 acyl-CoA carboxylase subunit beta [Lutimaribacter sp. EGI FJ00014]
MWTGPQLGPDSPGFDDNRARMLQGIEHLRALERRAAEKSEQRRARFHERGQITPRERLARLLDPGMPFLRLHSLAGYLADTDDPDTSIPGSTFIAGIGHVSGVRAAIIVDDSGINAGALSPMALQAILSVQDIALRQRLPFIHLVESAGANLMNYRVEDWAHGGAVFRNLARLSAAGLPTVAVLHGPSTAGGAYMPGLSDYVIAVKENGMAALAGAALVHAATGETTTDKEVGGAEMHATVSGLVEYLAENDAHAIDMARRVMARLDWNRDVPAPKKRDVAPPSRDMDELAGIVPTDPKTPYDMREVVARLVDGSDFDQFKPDFGPATLCLQAQIHGITVGILANNGPIDPNGANKATHFIQACDQAGTPLIFLNNTTGYMVGTAYERAGIIKHGSKMIQAVSNADVPKITLYCGASFGAGNYGMCGIAYQPDFLFAWPNSRSGVMGGEQAARTMSMVARAGAKRRGAAPDEDRIAQQEATIQALFDRQSDPFFTSGRCLDHGVIDPRDSRKVLALCLLTCLEGRQRKLRPNSFGVARM